MLFCWLIVRASCLQSNLVPGVFNAFGSSDHSHSYSAKFKGTWPVALHVFGENTDAAACCWCIVWALCYFIWSANSAERMHSRTLSVKKRTPRLTLSAVRSLSVCQWRFYWYLFMMGIYFISIWTTCAALWDALWVRIYEGRFNSKLMRPRERSCTSAFSRRRIIFSTRPAFTCDANRNNDAPRRLDKFTFLELCAFTYSPRGSEREQANSASTRSHFIVRRFDTWSSQYFAPLQRAPI